MFNYYWTKPLVSTHVVCQRLCVMQDLGTAVRILCSKFLEYTHSSIWGIWCPEYPPPPAPILEARELLYYVILCKVLSNVNKL